MSCPDCCCNCAVNAEAENASLREKLDKVEYDYGETCALADGYMENFKAQLDSMKVENEQNKKDCRIIMNENMRLQDLYKSLTLSNAKLREALEAILNRYVSLANSGDAGFWDCETEAPVIMARSALSSPSTSKDLEGK